MRSQAVALCTLLVFTAATPSKAAAPELTQNFPAFPNDAFPNEAWPTPGATPDLVPDGPAFGPEGPRPPTQRKAETATPKTRKNASSSEAKTDSEMNAAKAEALKKAMAPHPSHAALRGQMLDVLFKRLAAAGDPEEAQAVMAAIEKIWAKSDSDTADLLMQRASAAMSARQFPLALELFDKIILLRPTWAEAWNKRATVRFLGDDMDGAMEDIEQVLKLEPRHFGALTGMGFIMQKEGLDKGALAAFRKALELNPQQPEIKSKVEKLTVDVEGRGI
jgi:tetratricopeptide (TPR) repeat protein